MNSRVRLTEAQAGPLVSSALRALPDSVDDALSLAVDLGRAGAMPGGGDTVDFWEVLATVGAHDLGAARAIEPHLDAIAIMAQAGRESLAGDETWGVFAAEGGEDPLIFVDGVLSGTKAWGSLADRLDAAIVTAHVGDDRGLFAVDLHADGVTISGSGWHPRGLIEIPSGPVTFSNVPAVPIGEPGWYLARPGFSWGGIGVAACWHGGCVGVARSVLAVMREKPNPHGLAHLGAIDELLASNRLALSYAAARVDGSAADRGASDRSAADRILAKRVRATIARSVEEILWRSAHALGPAPLALDEAHAKRVADLQLYVRQHHAERDQASLGSSIVDGEENPW